MRTLPVFLDLSRGPIVLVGAGPVALAKLRTLHARGATVDWYPIGLDRGQASALVPHPGKSITIEEGEPDEAGMTGALAVVSAAGGEVDGRVSAIATRLGIPLNVVDRPELSTFVFPAIVDRGEVVVAIGTGGASPVLARRLRERIEAILPARIGELAGLLRRLRALLKAKANPRASDRSFWQRLIDGPIAKDVLEGRLDEAEFRRRATTEIGEAKAGEVALVGAGPGDPDLLTLKALHALQDADIVFYDELVTPAILERARRDAALVHVGRRKGQTGEGQHNINRHMIDAARAGKRVVRLKGGDPFIFGRGGEEVEALRTAGVRVSVVPGITAALGCAAEAELPLTFRGEATRLILATAHTADDDAPIDWTQLGDPSATLAIYMGLSAAARVRDGLMSAGRDPDTPVAVLARGTRNDSRAIVGRLAELTALAARAGEGPALIVVGDAVRHSRPWRAAQEAANVRMAEAI